MNQYKNSNKLNIDLENIIPILPGYAYYKNSEGVYLACNNRFANLAGLSSPKEIIGKMDYDLPWKDQAGVIRRSELETLNTVDSLIFEEVLPLKHGSKVTFLSNKVAIRDFSGKSIGILIISTDITKEKEHENALQTSQDQTKVALSNILNNIPAHIFWKDRNCMLLGCNDLQAKSMGFSSGAEMVGKTNYDVIWPDQPEEERKAQARAITKIDMQVITTGETYTAEEPLVLPDGSTAIYLSKKTPLRDHRPEIVGLLGISFDITDRKKVEQELQEIKHKLDGMILVSASIAHELRTPLATLSLGVNNFKKYYPNFIEAYFLAEKANLLTRTIQKESFRLLEELPDVMESEVRAAFTFIDMLLMNVNTRLEIRDSEVFSIAKCVDEGLSRYPFTLEQRQLINWDSQNDFSVNGKSLFIIHILFNLIKNALYFIAKAQKGDIHIWLENGKLYNKLYFKDTGTGISEEILPHIFDRFFTKTYHGAGIGLTFCKMVMESLGGQITCDSIEGEYTLFVLSFPN